MTWPIWSIILVIGSVLFAAIRLKFSHGFDDMKTMDKKIKKQCQSCKQWHYWLPDNSREWIDQGLLIGVFFECTCKSTLLVRKNINPKLVRVK